jgi:hypothetical protein
MEYSYVQKWGYGMRRRMKGERERKGRREKKERVPMIFSGKSVQGFLCGTVWHKKFEGIKRSPCV